MADQPTAKIAFQLPWLLAFAWNMIGCSLGWLPWWSLAITFVAGVRVEVNRG